VSWKLWFINGFDYEENPFHYLDRAEELPYTNQSDEGSRLGFCGGMSRGLEKPFRLYPPHSKMNLLNHPMVMFFYVDSVVIKNIRFYHEPFYPIFTLKVTDDENKTEEIQLAWQFYYAHGYPGALVLRKVATPPEYIWAEQPTVYDNTWYQIIVEWVPFADKHELNVECLVAGMYWQFIRRKSFPAKFSSLVQAHFDFGADLTVPKEWRFVSAPNYLVPGWSIDHLACFYHETPYPPGWTTRNTRVWEEFRGRIVIECVPSSLYFVNNSWSDDLQGDLVDRNRFSLNWEKVYSAHGVLTIDGGGGVVNRNFTSARYGHVGHSHIRMRKYPSEDINWYSGQLLHREDYTERPYEALFEIRYERTQTVKGG